MLRLASILALFLTLALSPELRAAGFESALELEVEEALSRRLSVATGLRIEPLGIKPFGIGSPWISPVGPLQSSNPGQGMFVDRLELRFASGPLSVFGGKGELDSGIFREGQRMPLAEGFIGDYELAELWRLGGAVDLGHGARLSLGVFGRDGSGLSGDLGSRAAFPAEETGERFASLAFALSGRGSGVLSGLHYHAGTRQRVGRGRQGQRGFLLGAAHAFGEPGQIQLIPAVEIARLSPESGLRDYSASYLSAELRIRSDAWRAGAGASLRSRSGGARDQLFHLFLGRELASALEVEAGLQWGRDAGGPRRFVGLAITRRFDF